MQKFFSLFKNKFFLTFSLFLIYTFVLSDSDILYLFKKKNEIRKTNEKIELVTKNIDSLNLKLKNLKTKEGVEKFAREKKFFKRENEDIFVKSYKIDDVKNKMDNREFLNGLTILALQWFFLNIEKKN